MGFSSKRLFFAAADTGAHAASQPDALDEWLEADGLGGFASGTVSGIRTRRYHALLLQASLPPTGRLVLINGIEAWLESPAGVVPLSTQRYAPDIVHPQGWRNITAFTANPWPSWRFSLSTDASSEPSSSTPADEPSPDSAVPSATLSPPVSASTPEHKPALLYEIFASGDSGDIVLRWSVEGVADEVLRQSRLFVRPLMSVRDYHSLHHENDAFDFNPIGYSGAGRVSWRPYKDRPALSVLSNGEYRHAPEWFRHFLYSAEQDRGLDADEDLASPGVFVFAPSESAAVMILRAGDSRDVQVVERASSIALKRKNAATPDRLAQAAASYFVERGQGATIVAGYPWFTDWGRDTFISLRGLALATGRIREAGAILGEWARTVSEGMLPNRFPDGGEPPEYNSVDASLWFIVAMHAYLQAKPNAPADAEQDDRLKQAAEAILQGYRQGTRFGIGMRNDGLLHAGADGSQLTWMDARASGRAVTPRIGKPVEIQALWINALRIASAWHPEWGALADRAQTSFTSRFIDDDTGALFDIVDVDDIPGEVDRSIRPNQIFAVGGLPFTIVDDATAKAILSQVERELLTPLGLRTLSPLDRRYIGRYEGSPDARDNAYHQGTAWPWLTGAFIEAWLRVHAHGAQAETARDEVRRKFIAPLDVHLDRAGLGHISEIADGDAPHTPRGAPFQAWSLAERLRIEILLSNI